VAEVIIIFFGCNLPQNLWCPTVVDRGVGDWGSCPGHQGRGHQRKESKNNANLHDEKRD